MKRESRTVDGSDQVDSPTQRHLPLVDLLVDTRAELMELAVNSGLTVLHKVPLFPGVWTLTVSNLSRISNRGGWPLVVDDLDAGRVVAASAERPCEADTAAVG
jgi:hypothetical protein